MDRREGVILGGLGLGLIYLLTQKTKAPVVGRALVGRISDFILKNKDAATRVGKEYNLPVWLILTQGGHESGFGTSGLTLKANNLFGFTGEAWAKEGKPTVAMPTREFLKGVWVAVTRPFRAYASIEESMRDYARLLTTQPRYAESVANARRGDVPATWAALGRSGYATDPTYGEKLAGVHKLVGQVLA
jgi:flagellar protein FlgJ